MTQCIAFITAMGQNKLWSEDLLIAQKLRDEHGIRVLIVPWGRELPKTCQAVVLRSCHDYPKHLQMFKVWLQSLEEQKVIVLNHLSLVRDNLDKRYLLDLQKRGVSIVSTVLFEAGSQVSLTTARARQVRHPVASTSAALKLQFRHAELVVYLTQEIKLIIGAKRRAFSHS